MGARDALPPAPRAAAGPGGEQAARPRISVILPAYNEAETIGRAVEAVRAALACLDASAGYEMVVIDDGSRDDTASVARSAGATVVRFERNRGKGAALERGFRAASGQVFLMLDADLAGSAGQCEKLLRPILRGEADMTVAVLPPAGGGGGLGTVVRVARWGVERLTGRRLAAPLSGQRALTRAVWERIGRVAPGYGAETGLDVDVLRAGFRLLEVPTEMSHRAHGRSWAGFRHRGRQLLAVIRTLLARSVGQ